MRRSFLMFCLDSHRELIKRKPSERKQYKPSRSRSHVLAFLDRAGGADDGGA
jgi:hypothetical protein